MKTSGYHEDDVLLLNAYVDGELDAAAALDVEHRLAADPLLRLEFERLSALHTSIATNLHKEIASDALRKKIAGVAEPTSFRQASATFRKKSFEWRQLAACMLVTAGLASGVTYMAARPDADSIALAAILAGHQRSLLSASPVDVASSDRHTVKPWFDTRLAISPQVPDLASVGYPLIGGRIDIVGGQAVPTMVYRHRQHLISLTAVPSPGSRDDGTHPTRETRDGYAILTWNGRDFVYSAVSDVAKEDLEDFQSRWRAAIQAE